ncbi:hypothetical protein DPMN_115786 [Dreissena polymorpha]|uniref:Uncharacterized protein n=1 Tax=Dreissena polymorpha TaxID=45954 RepID=A0A9D4KMM0_DREPO|nr:hypothetical protein DPMN_115783 [Dreissena polymorpha]KAH3842289.1 hypothetical protein DPMN_115786 [Dreissena polymorpha]
MWLTGPRKSANFRRSWAHIRGDKRDIRLPLWDYAANTFGVSVPSATPETTAPRRALELGGCVAHRATNACQVSSYFQ